MGGKMEKYIQRFFTVPGQSFFLFGPCGTGKSTFLRHQNPGETLDAYVTLYIREEVQQEGLVRNIGNFSRFLEAVSFSHASLLNVSNVARECEVERKTVEGLIQILEDILLAFRLPVFAKRAQRALVSRPKFYIFDSGVFHSLRPKGPLDRSYSMFFRRNVFKTIIGGV